MQLGNSNVAFSLHRLLKYTYHNTRAVQNSFNNTCKPLYSLVCGREAELVSSGFITTETAEEKLEAFKRCFTALFEMIV